MNVRESTLGAVNRYRMLTGKWPTRDALYRVLPDRVKTKIDGRLDALEQQGLIEIQRGRIVASVMVAERESL